MRAVCFRSRHASQRHCPTRPLSKQDTPLWHRADTDQYEDDGAGELFDFGQECFDRIAIALVSERPAGRVAGSAIVCGGDGCDGCRPCVQQHQLWALA